MSFSALRLQDDTHAAAPLWVRLLAFTMGIILAGVLAVCTGYAQAPAAQTPAAESPQRIVSLGGPVTEVIYALGAEDRLVGVDASSLYPQEAQELPSVGYFRQVPAEGILSLGPTLVLASEETGPPATLEQLRSAGVEVKVIPSAASAEGATAKIRTVAEALGLPEKGEALIEQMGEDLAEARALHGDVSTLPRVLFIYARGAGTMQVAGEGSSAEAMIELAGAENAITGFEGYKPMTAEAVAAAAPDVILVLDRGLESIGGVDGLIEQPGISLTPAGKNRRIAQMDDLLLLGFGPRLGEAVLELTQTLHPELQTTSGAAN